MNRKPEDCANYETRFKGGTCISCENYKPGPHRLDKAFKDIVDALKYKCRGKECASCPFQREEEPGCVMSIESQIKTMVGWKKFGA